MKETTSPATIEERLRWEMISDGVYGHICELKLLENLIGLANEVTPRDLQAVFASEQNIRGLQHILENATEAIDGFYEEKIVNELKAKGVQP
jgi:hypothetical protein